jgi:APA family basic amino acid/polyamine antiporter
VHSPVVSEAAPTVGEHGHEGASGALRRMLSLPGAIATSTGLAFAALNYLAVVSVAAYAPGTSAWLAMLLAGILAMLVAGLFSELNGLYPSAAGIRLYMSRALGFRAAMGVTFAYLFGVVLVMAADAFLIGAAIQHAIGGSRLVGYLVIVGLLGLAVVGNLLGVRIAGRFELVVTSAVIVCTAALSVVAIARVRGPFRTPLGLFAAGPTHVAQALVFAVFLYAAFEWVTTAAEEVARPQTVTRALFSSPLFIFVAAGLFGVALTHALPFRAVHHSPYPQLLLARRALGEAGELWMLAVTLLTALNTFNGGFLVASRFLYAAAREATLPRIFARLNVRAVPWVGVVALGSLAALVAIGVFATGEWLLLVSVGSALEAMIYVVASICVLVLRRRQPAARPFCLPLGRPLAAFGVVVFGLLTLAAAFSDPKHPSRFSLLPALSVLVLLALSTGYVRIVVPRLQAAAARRQAAARPRRRPQRAAAATEPGGGPDV